MRHAGVESVVQAVTLEVDILGYAVVERVVAEVVAVQLARQIRVPYVVDLRDPGQSVAGGRVALGGRHRCRLEGSERRGNMIEFNVAVADLARFQFAKLNEIRFTPVYIVGLNSTCV